MRKFLKNEVLELKEDSIKRMEELVIEFMETGNGELIFHRQYYKGKAEAFRIVLECIRQGYTTEVKDDSV